MNVGFVGAGNMASAMARGWASAMKEGAAGAPSGLLFTDSGSGRAQSLASELGGTAVASLDELAAQSDLILLACKPGGLGDVAPPLAAAGKPVMSVLGATSVDQLEAALGKAPSIRVMPNVGVELRKGVMAYAFGAKANGEVREQARVLLELLGMAVELADNLIDPATAVMGCSPAYVALFAEALIDAGVMEGIPEETALAMVAATLDGTAALLGKHNTLEVRRSVTSPGGSTAAGLEALERGALRAALSEAVAASLAKMRG